MQRRSTYAIKLPLACAALALVAGFVAAEQIETGWIAQDTPFATRYFVRDSGQPGPTVMVVGGIHGDEPAGAMAASQMRHWSIRRGRLVVLPQANVPALAAGKRLNGDQPEDQRNLNRNFPSDEKGLAPRGTPATAIWQLVRHFRPDWLLDLHEGYGFHQLNSETVGSSVIASRDAEAQQIAKRLLDEINTTIDDPKRKFVQLSPPVDGSLARAAAQQLGAHAFILETTRQSQPLSLRTRQHRQLVHRVLVELGMRAATDSFEQMTPRWAAGASPAGESTLSAKLEKRIDHVYVALFDAGGTGERSREAILRLLQQREQTEVAAVGPPELVHLRQFDVVVFPGGSGSREAAAIGPDGHRHVQQYVRQGGGLVGVCAGMYLMCSGFSWGLHVLDAETVSPRWRRGQATLEVELTTAGQRLFADQPKRFRLYYANGPIIRPGGRPDLPDYVSLARFLAEVAENDAPRGVMIDAPAAVAARFGAGRVVGFSAHPDLTPGQENLLLEAILWVSGRNSEPNRDPLQATPAAVESSSRARSEKLLETGNLNGDKGCQQHCTISLESGVCTLTH